MMPKKVAQRCVNVKIYFTVALSKRWDGCGIVDRTNTKENMFSDDVPRAQSLMKYYSFFDSYREP